MNGFVFSAVPDDPRSPKVDAGPEDFDDPCVAFEPEGISFSGGIRVPFFDRVGDAIRQC
jgi:hypothetical protein